MAADATRTEAERRSGRSDHDAIVVGGGHNGLICAAYLARAGMRALVLEARADVGGCASTVSAVGARVNICNCDHIAVRSLPLVDELDLEVHGLRYLDLDPAQVIHSWADEPPAVLFHDVERTLDSLRLTHPDQVDGYQRYLDEALPVARLVRDITQQVPTPGAVLGKVARRRAVGAGRLLRWSRRSVAQVLRQYLSSETLLGGSIALGPAVWGVSPHLKGTGLGALRLASMHLTQGGRPVGGSGALTDAVRRSFETAGGTTRCAAVVDSLLVEGDAVRGVRLRGGEELLAPTVVVACDPRFAFLEWLGDPPPAAVAALVEKWRGRPTYDGYESKIDAVVDRAPTFTDLDEGVLRKLGVDEPLVPTNVLAPAVDGIAAAHRDGAAGRVAARPVMLVNVPSVLDRSMAPPSGGHVFSLEVLFTPYALPGGWPASSEPQRWLDVFASRVAPGFLDGVRDWRAMTPDVYERELHLPRGYAQSFAGGPLAALLGRDPELSRYETPLRGLYLTGAATFPGAGVWGAPGRNAASVVLGSWPHALRGAA